LLKVAFRTSSFSVSITLHEMGSELVSWVKVRNNQFNTPTFQNHF